MSSARIYGTKLGRNGAVALWAVLLVGLVAYGIAAGRFPPIGIPLIGFLYFVRQVGRVRIAGDDVVLEQGFKVRRMKVSDLIAVRFSMKAAGVELHTKHGDFDVALGKKRTTEFLKDLRTLAPHVEISGFKGLYY